MKIDVLALGESIADFSDSGNLTIGVNDIAKHHQCDFIVTADSPSRFTSQRLQTIVHSKCIAVVSHYPEWRSLVQNFRHINLLKGRGNIDLHSSKFSYSNNSAFIACVLAFKLGAKVITMYGVDLVTHPNLGRKALLDTARKDFKNLRAAMKLHDVILQVSQTSQLRDILPKQV
jgi:hypothetical protein